MSPDIIYPCIMAGLVLVSGTVSGAETALFSLRPSQRVTMRDHGDALGRQAVSLLDDGRRLLLSILIANNTVNIAYFSLASLWARKHDGVIAGTIVITALVVLILCGEILPKVVASRLPERISRLVAPLLRVLLFILRPACRLIELFFGGLPEESGEGTMVTSDEVKLVIEKSHEHGVVSRQIHDRLIEVIDLAAVPVRRVMTHRVDCPNIAVTADLAAAVAAIREKPSPYVLVLDEKEDCVGVLMTRDILRGGRPAQRMHKPVFVPAGAMLAQVIVLFRECGVVVVVDEYGVTLGMLTLAHLGNELLGIGSSEDLPDLAEAEQLNEQRWRLPGGLPLEAWMPLFDVSGQVPGCTTIGGFITRELGSLPEPGDTVLFNNLLFHVEEVKGRRIRSLVMERLSPGDTRRLTQQMTGGRG